MSKPGEPLIAVVGPLGFPLTRDTLPAPDTVRWNARRKAELLLAIRAELISLREAVELYNLSGEEIMGWSRLFERHGLEGLKSTKAQNFRQNRRRPLTAAAADTRPDEPAAVKGALR